MLRTPSLFLRAQVTRDFYCLTRFNSIPWAGMSLA
jgi:hypothetical protein